MFQRVPLSIIRSFSLHTQQWYNVIQILLCVQWKTPDDGQRNCPKHVEFYPKNKFEELVQLVGFIIRIIHDARSPEHQESPIKLYVWSGPTGCLETSVSDYQCTLRNIPDTAEEARSHATACFRWRWGCGLLSRRSEVKSHKENWMFWWFFLEFFNYSRRLSRKHWNQALEISSRGWSLSRV